MFSFALLQSTLFYSVILWSTAASSFSVFHLLYSTLLCSSLFCFHPFFNQPLYQMIFQVWDRYNPDVSDYVRVSVGYGIQSSRDDIHEGDLVCFKSTKSPGEGKFDSYFGSIYFNYVTLLKSLVNPWKYLNHRLPWRRAVQICKTWDSKSFVEVSLKFLKNELFLLDNFISVFIW